MSDRHDRHEFLQLVDEVMNFGDADQFTENDADIRPALLHAYFKVPMTNESGILDRSQRTPLNRRGLF